MNRSADSGDELDLRPLPDAGRVASAITGLFDALSTVFLDTPLEPGPVLWDFVDVFYQQTAGIQRELDDNAGRLSAAQKQKLIDRHGVFKSALDCAIGRYKAQTGLDWRPCVGSQETM